MVTDYDFLVLGSGIGGLTFALRACRYGRVAIITKKERAESNTNYAQGGIAGVMSDDDSFELHREDTLKAGAGLCHEDAVDILVKEGPDRIRDLIAMGARFNRDDESGLLDLGREGGHSRRRIVHAVDRTGWECERALLAAVQQQDRISVFEHYFAVDFLRRDLGSEPKCIGAVVFDTRAHRLVNFYAKATLLATGGCGQIYLHTTNPLIATGDGVAMAWRAGVPIANMEFIQFHPTTLAIEGGHSFLLSEAMRGEGAVLKTRTGDRFMPRYHELADLAPRDVVARAIYSELEKSGDRYVFLDITHRDPDFVKSRFPTIYQQCISLGLDITKEPIPVVPAAHYSCGGALTDISGATVINGLYACGEVACSGVHGANRLASNSLLEAMVFGYRAAESLQQEVREWMTVELQPYSRQCERVSEVESGVIGLQRRLQTVMQQKVNLVRSNRSLAEAAQEIEEVERESRAYNPEMKVSVARYELRNMIQVAKLIVQSAISRKESRGLHYNTDFPDRDHQLGKRDTILSRA